MLVCSHIYKRGPRKGRVCGRKCRNIDNKGLCHVHAGQYKYKEPPKITQDEFEQNLKKTVHMLLQCQNTNNNKPRMTPENFGDVWEVVLTDCGDDLDVCLRYV